MFRLFRRKPEIAPGRPVTVELKIFADSFRGIEDALYDVEQVLREAAVRRTLPPPGDESLKILIGAANEPAQTELTLRVDRARLPGGASCGFSD